MICEKKTKSAKRPKLDFEDEYEVERIVKHCEVEPNKYLYFIKWRGWASSHNTWEPLENLNCDLVLHTYFKKLAVKTLDEKKINEIRMSLIDLGQDNIDKLLADYTDNGKLKLPKVNKEIVDTMLLYLASMDPDKWDDALRLKLKSMLEVEVLTDLRLAQLESLQNWEKKMNSTAVFKVPLRVENNVDLEGPPRNFTFVKDYVCGKGIEIPTDPIIGCDCGERCKGFARKCCAMVSNSVYAYAKGKLNVEKGTPIYECNKRCSCGPNCSNRVIQHGRSSKLCIFRTSNNCGWGLKALDNIRKGTFITQYVGEVITNEEAEKRGIQYDADGRTYLFDLDFNGEEAPYTVDATAYGNESHFINHSCDPNTAIFAAFVDCLDPNLPLLAIFAIRDIKAGEEITFDYSSQSKAALDESSVENSEENTESTFFTNYLCKCGASNCRKYLFT